MNRRDYLESIGALGMTPTFESLDFGGSSEQWAGTTRWIVGDKVVNDEEIIGGSVAQVDAIRLTLKGPERVTLDEEEKVDFYGPVDEWECVGVVHLGIYQGVEKVDMMKTIRPIVAKGYPVKEWAEIKMEKGYGK